MILKIKKKLVGKEGVAVPAGEGTLCQSQEATEDTLRLSKPETRFRLREKAGEVSKPQVQGQRWSSWWDMCESRYHGPGMGDTWDM